MKINSFEATCTDNGREEWVGRATQAVSRNYMSEEEDGSREVGLCLWWDDQPGVKPGWCLRLTTEQYGREQEHDMPVRGRYESKRETLLRNVRKALCTYPNP